MKKAMSFLGDDIWRTIIELGVKKSNWECQDLCCLSITCKRFNLFSSEDALWSHLIFSDFYPHSTNHSDNPNQIFPDAKSLYIIRFEREKERKLMIHTRAVLRGESQVYEHSKELQEILQGRAKVTEKLHSTSAAWSNLHRVWQAPAALDVWQEKVIHALDMEVKLLKKQLDEFHKAFIDEMERLDAAKEATQYHPLRDYKSTRLIDVEYVGNDS